MFIVLWLGCAIVTSIIANAKGCGWLGWLALGVLFGIFALIVILALPTRRHERARTPCPECAELILPAARRCPHCAADLSPLPVWTPPQPLKSKPSTFFNAP